MEDIITPHIYLPYVNAMVYVELVLRLAYVRLRQLPPNQKKKPMCEYIYIYIYSVL